MKPYTHRQIGVPTSINIGGNSFEVILDGTLMDIKKNTDPLTSKREPFNQRGVWGVARIKENQILMWPGNAGWVPPIEKVREALWEEILHAALFVMHTRSQELSEGYLWRNESFVGGLSNIMYQVSKQLTY